MFIEQYEQLSEMEKENVQRLFQLLLGQTFLLKETYLVKDKIWRLNPDYLFIERYFELFESYLSYSGFRLARDDQYGVISLGSDYNYNQKKFDKMPTLMLYVIRLMYEEQREALNLGGIFMTTGELVHKMLSLGVIAKKPTNKDCQDALKTLAKFNIIDRVQGIWEDEDTIFVILPTILFVVSNDRINVISGEVERVVEESQTISYQTFERHVEAVYP